MAGGAVLYLKKNSDVINSAKRMRRWLIGLVFYVVTQTYRTSLPPYPLFGHNALCHLAYR